MCTKTKQKRERPSVPLTTRIDIPVADRLAKISGEKLWAFLFSVKFVIYACILLAVVTRLGK